MSGIRVELQLKDGSFTTGMLRAGQSVSSFRSELARVDPHFRKMDASGKKIITTVRRADVVNKSLLSTLRDVSIVGGAVALAFRGITGATGGLIGSITQVNAEIERLKYQMLGMSVSAEPMREAAASVEYLRQRALQVPFSLNELATSFVKLKATGTDPMAGSLQAVADGIAAFGGTDERLHRVTLGLVQMSGKGVIQMEEMRQQLGESMPNAMRIMARSMGVSVAELTKAISTGRVESGAALQSFYAELERTYGGEAQRMMDTFSGQVSQLKANLQLLATGDGMSSFFEEQKSGLMELNDFLQSDNAKEFAKELGNALTAMVRGIRIATKTIYDLREEIALVAQVVAGGLALKLLGSTAMRAATAMNFARLAVGGFATQMASGVSMMRLGVQGLVTMQAAGTSTALVFGGLRTAVVGFGSAVMVAAPWLAAIGAALAIAGDKMGWFGSNTDDAYDSLVRFGAESRNQAENILEDRERDLLRQIKKAERDYNMDWSHGRAGNPVRRQRIEELKAELEEFKKERKRILADADENSASESVRRYKRELAGLLRSHNETYRQRQVQIDINRDAELAKTSETGKKAYEITEAFQEATLKNRKERSKSVIATYDAELERLQALQNDTTDADKAREIGRLIDFLNGKRLEAAEEARGLDNFGISFVADIENEEDKIKRGTKLLDNLKSKVQGVQAELVGAGSAYAKLQFEISRGDYGDIEQGGEAVRMLHEGLLQATLQKEALDKLMKGDKQAESDVDAMMSRAIERRQRAIEGLNGEELLDSEKFLLRLNTGFYEGLGPMDNIKADINQVGIAMRENAFGSQTVNQITTVNEALATTLGLVTGLKDGAGRIGFGGIGQPSTMTGAMKSSASHILQLLAEEGVTGQAAAGIVGNFKVESAFNTGAIGDNGKSFGLAQWHKSRWDGLKAHSEALGLDQSDARAQIKFLMHELKTDYPDLLARMNLAANPAEAASMFMREFERPHKDHANEAGRRSAAMAAAGLTPGGVNPSAGSIPALPFDTSGMINNRAQRTNDLKERAREVTLIEKEAIAYEESIKRAEALRKLLAEQAGAEFETDGMGSNYARMIQSIQTGQLGSNKDIDAEIYQEILAAAKELDEIEKTRDERAKAKRQSEEQLKSLEQDRADIAQRISEEQSRIANPDYQGQSNDLRTLIADLDKYVDRVGVAFGAESAEYKAAQQYRSDLLGDQRLLDVTERQAALAGETRDIRESLMNQSQLRRAQFKRDLARVDQWVKDARKAGMEEVEIVRQAEAMKAAIRDQYQAQTNPVSQQMEQWKDYSGQLMDQTTSWMDSLAGGVSGLITGTGDLQGAVNGILNDVVTAQVKYLYSSMAGDKTANAAGKLGGKGGGKSVGQAHTGGIAGGRLKTVKADPAAFINAPKFHTGGVVGVPRLKKDEVPIVAKKKEGIFTEEQMAALAPVGSGAGSVTINAPVTVNGSAGTHEENQDLAKRMAREMEATMRGVVVQEIRNQQRPGNMMNIRR